MTAPKGPPGALAKKYKAGRYSGRLRRTIADIAALHARAGRRRLDFTHKLTTDLAKNHGFVGIEDLAVKNMTRSARGTKTAPGKGVAQKAGLNRALLDNMAAERRPARLQGTLVRLQARGRCG